MPPIKSAQSLSCLTWWRKAWSNGVSCGFWRRELEGWVLGEADSGRFLNEQPKTTSTIITTPMQEVQLAHECMLLSCTSWAAKSPNDCWVTIMPLFWRAQPYYAYCTSTRGRKKTLMRVTGHKIRSLSNCGLHVAFRQPLGKPSSKRQWCEPKLDREMNAV